MDLYHAWFDKRPGVGDVELCRDVEQYLSRLVERGLIASFRITRKKLGLASSELPEFHVMIETRDLAQLEQAFSIIASRAGETEGLHAVVNQNIVNARFALYRDFPDEVRVQGEERF